MSRTVRLVTMLGLAGCALAVAAQEPTLDQVAARVGTYVTSYHAQLASVVAEESYTQTLDHPGPAPAAPGPPPNAAPETRFATTRILRSDYALTRVEKRGGFIGYRDTFEIDGRPVRDREERLQHLLTSGAVNQAARIAEQNARFNLAEELLTRNINVPTLALELLHPVNRDRFSFKRAGSERINGQHRWVIEFRERAKPTIVRTPEGRDQPSRILAVVDPLAGTVVKTTISWEKVTGSIVVTYGLVPQLPALVPLTMSERYATRDGSRIAGEATYSNYRQFQTSGRVITP